MYRVHLSEFDGPLDLLLFFIKRDELNIYDIPISQITEEFLSYLNTMKELDLEVAAEFIYMAALLISIKAKMLLPRPEIEQSELDDFDPRTELVKRLIEYKRYKEVSVTLEQNELERRQMFHRQIFESIEISPEKLEKKASIFDLIQAFHRTIERFENRIVHTIERIPVTIEEQSEAIMDILAVRERISFTEILTMYPIRIYIVVTFLAILEMTKSATISIFIEDDYANFWITRPVEVIQEEPTHS